MFWLLEFQGTELIVQEVLSDFSVGQLWWEGKAKDRRI